MARVEVRVKASVSVRIKIWDRVKARAIAYN